MACWKITTSDQEEQAMAMQERGGIHADSREHHKKNFGLFLLGEMGLDELQMHANQVLWNKCMQWNYQSLVYIVLLSLALFGQEIIMCYK